MILVNGFEELGNNIRIGVLWFVGIVGAIIILIILIKIIKFIFVVKRHRQLKRMEKQIEKLSK